MNQMQLPTAKMVIHPSYYEGKNGKRYNATLMQPTQVNLEVSKQSGNAKQFEAVLKQCADNGEAVEVEFISGKDNFGNAVMTLFDVKPLSKSVSSSTGVK